MPRQYRRPNDNKPRRTPVTDIFRPPDLHDTQTVPTPSVADPEWRQALAAAADYPYPDPMEAMNEPGPDYTEHLPVPPDAVWTEETPWGRMDNETDISWERFCYYRGLGHARTKVAVARKFEVTDEVISQAAKKYNWDHRIRAWDEYRERTYTVEVLEQTRNMALEHAEVAARGIRTLATAFDAIEAKMQQDPEGFIGELAQKDVKQLLTIAQRSAQVIPNLMNVERLSRGLPTEISASLNVNEHRVTIQSRDELAAIAFGLADVLSGSQEETVIDVGGRSVEPGEDTHPEDDTVYPD